MGWIQTISVYLMGTLYTLAGVNHFVNPGFYLRIMPPYIPAHAFLVALSGVIEIVLGLGVMLPATRWYTGVAIILMLLAFMPVHIHMLVRRDLFPEVPLWGLWVRFVLQAVMIWWAWSVANTGTME